MKADPKLRPGDVLVRTNAAGRVVQRYLVLAAAQKDGRLRVQEPSGKRRPVDWKQIRDLPQRWHRESASGASGGPVRTYSIRTKTIARGSGVKFDVRALIEASSPFEALETYLDQHPFLEQIGAIRPGRPGTAMMETVTVKGPRRESRFVAWPEPD